jgi:hypothetical protein
MKDKAEQTETEVDVVFAKMADDRDYQASAKSGCREFELCDWEAFRIFDTE